MYEFYCTFNIVVDSKIIKTNVLPNIETCFSGQKTKNVLQKHCVLHSKSEYSYNDLTQAVLNKQSVQYTVKFSYC